MKNSKELMKVAKIYPKLRLGTKLPGGGVKSTGPHRVRLVEDKIAKGIDRETGKAIEVVKYLVEENGQLMQYTVPVKNRETGELHYLVQRLSEVEEGQEIILEMKKRGIRNYVEVLSADGQPIEPSADVEYEQGDEPTGGDDDADLAAKIDAE